METPGPDTIAALATPAGRGSVGVIRVSGPEVPRLARELLGRMPSPRVAQLMRFLDADGTILDQGLVLYFPAPASFTGEHVLELQGHGGPLVLDLVLRRLFMLGSRPARPGEFSERAFLNGRVISPRASTRCRRSSRNCAPKSRPPSTFPMRRSNFCRPTRFATVCPGCSTPSTRLWRPRARVRCCARESPS
jgi:hypothetical protein